MVVFALTVLGFGIDPKVTGGESLVDQLFCLLSHRFRIWRLSLQQTSKGVVSWRLPFGLAPGSFCTGEYLLSSNEKVDVIQLITFGWVHLPL
jgi:hypothetical protein